MQVDCPDCGASLEGDPGAEMVCPACMTPFLVPSLARAVRAFDVQPAGDAVLYGLSRHAIREAIYIGRFDASTKVRRGGGKWELIGGYPEFAAVFRLLGGDLAPMAGTRKLAGWGRARGEAAAATPARTSTAAPGTGSRGPSTRESSAFGAPSAVAASAAAASATRTPTAPGTRTPTLVPAPSKDGPPPPLPAATAPVTAATLAAAADAEAEAPPTARPVTRLERPAPPNRVPVLAGALVVLSLVAAWMWVG